MNDSGIGINDLSFDLDLELERNLESISSNGNLDLKFNSLKIQNNSNAQTSAYESYR